MPRIGDFSELALTPRLLARSPERLLSALPAFRPEEVDREGPSFRQRTWSDEATAVLEVGNFIHELWHVAQFTTRSVGVFRVSAHYEVARRTNNFLAALQNAGHWPPPLPLLHRAGGLLPTEFTEWHFHIRLLDLVTHLREGREDMLQEFRDDPTCPADFKALTPNPKVADLRFPDDAWVGNQGDVPIDASLLIESEATYIERRFLEHWFGETGRDVFLAGIGDALRPDYDVLPILANAEGMACLLPFLVDWALHCPLMVPLKMLQDHRNPAHRFVELYGAARKFQGIDVPGLCEHREEVVEWLAAETGIPRPEPTTIATFEYLRDFCGGAPMNGVLVSNMTLRLAKPEYFLWPEKHLGVLMGNLAVPHFVFRDSPDVLHAFDVLLTSQERQLLHRKSLWAFNCLTMAFDSRLECPWCSLARPNVGARMGGGDASRRCTCGWQREFTDHWGFDPLEYRHDAE